MGGGAAVGAAQETVTLEARDVAADRHLRDAELRRELGEVDRLLLRHPLEDAVAAVNCEHAPPPSSAPADASRRAALACPLPFSDFHAASADASKFLLPNVFDHVITPLWEPLRAKQEGSDVRCAGRGAEAPSRQSSQLFVRQSTGLVREASWLDATIFNAVFSAPVGATLAWGVFFALTAFPGADLVAATLWSFVLNIPILIMMSLLASSMPKTGGDYVWVSRILIPPAAHGLELRRRVLGDDRRDVLGALLPGLRRRPGAGHARHDLQQPRA